ncbi:MAG TPA: hypothetical protein DCM05_07960 [Elusimicrobia bacterium]|nr:hypothetical protein [Elusimicrobiota bacterium]
MWQVNHRGETRGIGGGGGWGAAARRLLVSDLARRYYLDAAKTWPISAPGSARHDAACAHLLRVLELIRSDAKLLPGGGSDVRAALMRLPLLRTLSGASLSLQELSEQPAPLRYASGPVSPVPAADRLVPILEDPDAVARILGAGSLRRYRGRTPTASAPTPSPPMMEEGTLEERLCGLFSRLRGRRGMKLDRPLATLRIDADAGGDPLVCGEEGWTIRGKNPLVEALLSSGLAPEEQTAYLASLCYTAFNRTERTVTDEDDARFQRALTDSLVLEARKKDG